jgi:hypothetical protein
MPTYLVTVKLYVDGDDIDDARHIAKELMVDFVKAVDVVAIRKIKEPRFERTLTVDQLDAMWKRSEFGEPPAHIR